MSKKRDFLSITDLTPDETLGIIHRARELKCNTPSDSLSESLGGKSLALLFEKPSLRTKTSFQVGIQKLGGYSVYLGREEVGLGTREPISDVARVLSGYVDGIIARVNSHRALEELASYATVPVINALSDWEHPCQILADMLTIDEHVGRFNGKKLAFIGDGNNVARSLCLALPALGTSFSIATPKGYNLDDASLVSARESAQSLVSNRVDSPSVKVLALADPVEAVNGADAVYTDVWASMGQEEEAAKRQRAFKGYTVGPDLLSQAKPGAIFMHDMPAHYGEEVPPGMLDHPQSVAYHQAHNRLHAQMALLEHLIA